MRRLNASDYTSDTHTHRKTHTTTKNSVMLLFHRGLKSGAGEEFTKISNASMPAQLFSKYLFITQQYSQKTLLGIQHLFFFEVNV